jgi:hypothetical protein
MIDFTYDLGSNLARSPTPSIGKVGGPILARVTFSAAPGTASAFYLALALDQANPSVLAYVDTWSQVSATQWQAVLDATDTRLVTFIGGKTAQTLAAEFGVTLDGQPFVSPNFSVTIQPALVTGATTSEGGPSYYTQAQTDAAIAAAVSGATGQRGRSALTSGESSHPIVFPVAFNAPPTEVFARVLIPSGGSFFAVEVDASTITTTGFTAVLPAGLTVPGTGYLLAWIAFP